MQESVRPWRSDALESRLRRFRAHELRHRHRPTATRVAVDLASRLIPMCLGYLGMLALAYPYSVVMTVVFAVANVSMLASWFHDGVHGLIRAPRPVAAAIVRVACSPIGWSPRWWVIKHVRLHHRYPGNPAFDPDIQLGHLARLTWQQPWRRRHFAQHIHMWLLYPIATLNTLRLEEPKQLRRYAAMLGARATDPPWVLAADKYIGPLVVWFPVFLLLPLTQALTLFAAYFLLTGFLVAMISQVQHNTTLADASDDFSGRWPLCDQLCRTTDVGRGTGLWWWISGGVNLHVVHHLAPTLTFLELPGATQRLRENLREAGTDVQRHRDIGTAIRSHAVLLRELSRPPVPERCEV